MFYIYITYIQLSLVSCLAVHPVFRLVYGVSYLDYRNGNQTEIDVTSYDLNISWLLCYKITIHILDHLSVFSPAIAAMQVRPRQVTLWPVPDEIKVL